MIKYYNIYSFRGHNFGWRGAGSEDSRYLKKHNLKTVIVEIVKKKGSLQLNVIL